MINYTVKGTAGDEQSWTVSGSVPHDIGAENALNGVMRDAFLQLTNGRAVFGQPGVGYCRGPYKIKRVELEVS